MRTGIALSGIAVTNPSGYPLLGVGREFLGEADQAFAR